MPAKSGEMAGKLADWFRGESESINIGILPSPTKEKTDPIHSSCSEMGPTPLLQRKSTASAPFKPGMASRLSFFSSKVSSTKAATNSVDLNDDLIELDISAVLIPSESPDPYSPAAFKSLQQRAESLLLRLRSAYKERTISLRDIVAEKEALVEETESAETRARQLKTQLDEVSAKLAEQDEAMMNLVDELAQEKLARREEEEARKRSIRLVEHAGPPRTSDRRISLSNTVSDSGFESEDDSSAESVFSRRNGAYSPTLSMSSVSTNNSPEAYHTPDFPPPLSLPQAARLRSVPNHAAKGTRPFQQRDIAEEPTQPTSASRSGAQASEAWGVVRLLKEENSCLKQRVGELEGALDGCLDLVSNLS